jgi:hypothetical protein
MIVPVAARTLATGFPDVQCQAQPGWGLPTRPQPPDANRVDDNLGPAPTIVTGKGDNGPGLYLPVIQSGRYDLPPLPDGPPPDGPPPDGPPPDGPPPDGLAGGTCQWATLDDAAAAVPHPLTARPLP